MTNKSFAHHHAEHITHPKYRPDIDGLRAIAIFSVIGYHAFPFWVKGGFIGVDIFFIISGFLISTIIFSSLSRNTFSFLEFYSRRIKRIFPALLLVLVACFAFGWFSLLADEYKQLGKHIAGGAGFISNFLFWNESGYFDTSADTKPLLHLWSLGIEEQFYILWPLLLWWAWKQKLNSLSIILIIGMISFVLNVQGTKTDPVAAFYSPQTRFWELVIGSLLAYAALYRQNSLSTIKLRIDSWLELIVHSHPQGGKGDTLRNVMSFLGLLFIVFGLLRITKEGHYPGTWALLPTIGAALIISAGAHAWVNRKILASRILVWFGLISYPLYLWHWPLLSFARIIESETPSRNIRIAAILISIVLAWLTYKLLEMPLRFGKFGTTKTVVLVFLMCIVGLGAYDAFKNNRVSSGAAKVESLSSQIGWTIPVGSTEQVGLCHNLFPERTLLTSKERDDNFCYLEKNAPPNVLLVGDSLNLSLFPGISKNDKMNALVLSASMAAPFYNIRTAGNIDPIRWFNYKLTNQALDYALINDGIKVVVMSFLSGPLLTDTKGDFKITNIKNINDKDARHIFTEALASTIKKLLENNKKIIYILPNPSLTYDIKSCLASYRPLKLADNPEKTCSESYPDYLNRGGREYREWVSSVLKDFPQVRVIDLAKLFCDKDNCWGMKGGKVLYRDDTHLSVDGSEFVSPVLTALISEELNKN